MTHPETKFKQITIYGSYLPPIEKKRLEGLREFLKRNNFINTNLVSDYPEEYFPFELEIGEDELNYKRSVYCVSKSDLNIFIFTFTGIQGGVSTELYHNIDTDLDNYLIFIEEDESCNVACTSLLRGKLNLINQKIIKFPKNDDEYLCDSVYHRVIDFFL